MACLEIRVPIAIAVFLIVLALPASGAFLLFGLACAKTCGKGNFISDLHRRTPDFQDRLTPPYRGRARSNRESLACFGDARRCSERAITPTPVVTSN
jgi:hypothetical protein